MDNKQAKIKEIMSEFICGTLAYNPITWKHIKEAVSAAYDSGQKAEQERVAIILSNIFK